MAKSAQHDEATPRKRRGASVMAWILMAMLIGGLGGFGVTNFGGSTASVGSVGDKKIEVNDYARALRNQMNALSQQFGTTVTFQMAQSFGIDRQVLQTLIDNAALDNETDRVGLSVGNATVYAKLSSITAFHGVDGKIDPLAYDQVLQQNNLTKAEFERGIRDDTARELLQQAVTTGVTAPPALIDTIAAWAGEQRSFSLLPVTEASLLTPVIAPDAAALQAYYTANIADYTRPEAKRISYATLRPEDLAKDMPADEAALKAAYQARISEYVIPEKRLVERLGFGTEAEAAAAKARLDAGASFEELVTERNLTLQDVDLGDVTKSQLGEAGDAVFALTAPGVVGPLNSNVGPALFRMNAVLAAQETTFDQAKADLAKTTQLDAARKAIEARVNDIDDALAGGASLDDLVKEQGMIKASTDYAKGAEDNDPITADAKFAAAADKLAEGDFPEALILSDGSVVAMQLDSILPPTPLAFDAVKDKVTAAARAEVLAKALSDEAARIKAEVEAGKALDSFGKVIKVEKIDRQGQVKDAPASVLAAAFEMKPQELRVIAEPDATALVQLDSVTAAPSTGEDVTAMREAITTNANKAISDDILALYTTALTAEAGITLDQSAINSVNSQITN